MPKNVAQIVYTRHRTIFYFLVNFLVGRAAYAFYDTKPPINVDFEKEKICRRQAANFILDDHSVKQFSFGLFQNRRELCAHRQRAIGVLLKPKVYSMISSINRREVPFDKNRIMAITRMTSTTSVMPYLVTNGILPSIRFSTSEQWRRILLVFMLKIYYVYQNIYILIKEVIVLASQPTELTSFVI